VGGFSKNNIPDKQDIFHLGKQFVRFGVVGLSNTAISLAIYYVFILIDKDLYLIGNVVGFFVSVLNAYYWSNKYVFQKSVKGHVKPIIKTYMSYGITFLLSTGLLFTLVEYLQVPEAIAPLIILIVTIPMNFLLNKYWSFK